MTFPKPFQLLAVMLILGAPAVEAQVLELSGHKMSVDQEHLGAPWGWGASFGFIVYGPLAVRLGYERSAEDFRSMGTTCQGLVPPGADCSAEVRDEEARLSATTLAFPIRVVSTSNATVFLVPGVRSGKASTHQVGQRSGRTRSHEKSVYGPDLALELEFGPYRSWPVRLTLAGAVGRQEPYSKDVVIDGYTPLNESFTWQSFRVGLAYRW